MVSAANFEIPAAAVDTREKRAVSRPIGAKKNSVPETSMMAVATLVLWTSCAVVGWIGVKISYPRAVAVAPAAKPVQVEILDVQLTSDSIAMPVIAPSAPALEVPQPDQVKPLTETAAPPLIAVAEASRVEFALPVAGPVQIVEPSHASVSRPAETQEVVAAPQAVAAPQKLQYGYGEGKQPRPDYPIQAQRAGQEGVVMVRFSIAESGRVLSAEAVKPSPYAALNEAAVRAVREKWRFAAGAARMYDVAIRFELKKKNL